MQLFLDRLNLGPRTKAKNKLKWKENRQIKKANKKADEKLQCLHLMLSNTE